jgi:hypothetical protein
MPPLEPHLDESVGSDALRVWIDHWELGGKLRVDILRRSPSGGDPPKMIPPEVSVVTIPAVPAIVIRSDVDPVTDRAGEMTVGEMKLEMIDCVHESDHLRIGDVEYEISGVQERDFGSFRAWVVRARRIE